MTVIWVSATTLLWMAWSGACAAKPRSNFWKRNWGRWWSHEVKYAPFSNLLKGLQSGLCLFAKLLAKQPIGTFSGLFFIFGFLIGKSSALRKLPFHKSGGKCNKNYGSLKAMEACPGAWLLLLEKEGPVPLDEMIIHLPGVQETMRQSLLCKFKHGLEPTSATPHMSA